MNNKELVDRWYTELWNNGNTNLMDEMLHPDVKAYGLGTEPLTGIDAFKDFYKAFRDMLDDINVNVHQHISEGDAIASRCTVTAIDRATSKPVSFTGTSVVRFKHEQIIEGWNHFDFLTLNLQLGKITPEQLA